ncbi:MAG: hypothetical protein ACJ757_04860 [Gaiellaceae bacterium]
MSAETFTTETDLDGLSPEEIQGLLRAGKLDRLLGGTESVSQGDAKDADWLSKATPDQISKALADGELTDLLG